MPTKPLKWIRLNTKKLFSAKVFELYCTRLRNMETNFEDDFYSISSLDWVMVIPITKKDEIVLIRQYRHGINGHTLEIPGGLLDSAGENPLDAAKRELEEETGYTSQNFVSLGAVYPNPAVQSNYCHIFLALDSEQTSPQRLDPGEDIDVVPTPLSELKELIQSGNILHSMALCALMKLYASKYGEQIFGRC